MRTGIKPTRQLGFVIYDDMDEEMNGMYISMAYKLYLRKWFIVIVTIKEGKPVAVNNIEYDKIKSELDDLYKFLKDKEIV